MYTYDPSLSLSIYMCIYIYIHTLELVVCCRNYIYLMELVIYIYIYICTHMLEPLLYLLHDINYWSSLFLFANILT